jgi:hypothetical protein
LQIDVVTNTLNDQVEIHYTNGTYGVGDAGITSMSMTNQATWMVQTTPVPEPETYAMMLAGLGLLGFIARRRKQKEVAAV